MKLEIIGYKEYRVNTDTRTIERYKGGKWQKASYYPRCQYWTLYKKEPRANGRKTALKSSYIRLLYAAKNRIDPDTIPNAIKFITNGKGEIKPVSVRYYLTEWKARNGDIDVIEAYTGARAWIDTILEAYHTGNYNKVISRLYSYEKSLTDWIRRKGRGRSMEDARDIFHEAVNRALSVIIERKGSVFDPEKYIRYIIRSCIQKANAQRITEYNDNLYYK